MRQILKEKKGESGEIKTGWRRGRQDKNRGGKGERGSKKEERGAGGCLFYHLTPLAIIQHLLVITGS